MNQRFSPGLFVATALLATLFVAATSAEQPLTHVEKFVPLVAFQCGYRNRYMAENGTWMSDENKYATCVSGKLDILKYCKKSYPLMNVTNIVEYSHEMAISNWCREEGHSCHYENIVRPFRCIVGEFHSEALQVPHLCRFNHENSRSSCNDYQHWKNEAARICKTKENNGTKMSVRSYAMLEPCGLDLFTGVEFVCCPGSNPEKEAIVALKPVKETKEKDDEDDYDEDYEEDDDSEEEEKETLATKARDVYFTGGAADLLTEHKNFRAAIERIDMKHRLKINKVMKEWNELDARYESMRASDSKKAEEFKAEMTNRFQTTVASLEEEYKKAKKEVEEVHEERVLAGMNEKKRQATHQYRQALALSVGAPNKHNVLNALKAYIRAEEKDRIHTLNRYRHLLRNDAQEAFDSRPVFIHRLRYIDLRINGTMAMLHDFPDLEAQVRPIAMEFWHDFRRENTPELEEDQKYSLENLSVEAVNTKLLSMYEEIYKKNYPHAFLHIETKHAKEQILTTTPPKAVKKKASTTSDTAKVLPGDSEDSDSEEESDTYYEDDNDEEIKKQIKPTESKEKKPLIKINKAEFGTSPIVDPPKKADKAVQTSDENDSSEESSESEEKDVVKELKVDIEPIIEDKSVQLLPVYYRQDKLTHKEEHNWRLASSKYLFLFLGIVTTSFVIFILVGMRNRRRHIRFVEVDVCSPEERHVNGMQVNGYENPTYSFFDSKA